MKSPLLVSLLVAGACATGSALAQSAANPNDPAYIAPPAANSPITPGAPERPVAPGTLPEKPLPPPAAASPAPSIPARGAKPSSRTHPSATAKRSSRKTVPPITSTPPPANAPTVTGEQRPD